MPNNEVVVAGNAHFDPDWQWQFNSEGALEALGTTRAALEKMREFEEMTFEGLSPFLLPLFAAVDPELVAEMRQRTQEGRWGLSNLTWVEPDGNLPNFESMYRQVMLGLEAQARYLGATGTVLKVDDAFGMDRRWPDVLAAAGVQQVVFKRPGKEEQPLPGEAFVWIGQGGGSVLAQRVEEIGTWGKSLPRHIAKVVNSEAGLDRPKLALYGVSDHGGGPTREQVLSLLLFQQKGVLPEEWRERYHLSDTEVEKMREHWRLLLSYLEHPEVLEGTTFHFGTVERFGQLLAASNQKWPEWSNELQYHAVGCYLAEPGIKHSNQEAERKLSRAEGINVLAHLVTGRPYPHQSLHHAWKYVARNQFHDILPGSSIEPVYGAAQNELGAANTLAEREKLIAVARIVDQIDIPHQEGAFPVVAINEHPWPVTQLLPIHVRDYNRETHVLVDAEGKFVPMQDVFPDHHGGSALIARVTLPAFGYATFQLVKVAKEEKANLQAQWQQAHEAQKTEPTTAEEWQAYLAMEKEPELKARSRNLWESLPVTDREMENEHLRVTVDPRTGGILIYDKKLGYEVFKPGLAGAVPEVFLDTTNPNDPEPADTWGHWSTTFQTKDPTLKFLPVLIKRNESGPVVETIQVDSVLFRRTEESRAPETVSVDWLRAGEIPPSQWVAGAELLVNDWHYRIEAVDLGAGTARVVPYQVRWEPTSSKISQRFSLAADGKTVDVETDLKFEEKHRMVKLVFPPHANGYYEGYVETPAGVTGQPMDGKEHPVQRFLGMQFESKDRTRDGAKHRRGIFVMSPQASSGAITREEVQWSLTRTPVSSLHAPFERDPEQMHQYRYQGMGPLSFKYRIMPTHFSWQHAGVVREAMAFTAPAEAHDTNGHEGSLALDASFLEIFSPNVEAEIIEVDPMNRGYLLHLRETHQQGPTVARVSFMGREYELPLGSSAIETFLFPFDGGEPRVVKPIQEQRAQILHGGNGSKPEEAGKEHLVGAD